MPPIKQIDFARKYGLQPQHVQTYYKRGKLFIEDRKIDENHPVNRLFIAQLGYKVKEQKEEVKTDPQIKIKQSQKKEEPEEKVYPESEYHSVTLLSKLKALKLKEDIKYAKYKNDLIERNTYRKEDIEPAIFETINAYRAKNYIAAENVLLTHLKNLNANNDQITKAKTDLVALFNAASIEAIEQAKQVFEMQYYNE